MLNNLMAELIRKNIEPKSGIAKAIGCTKRTAKNKLNGISPFTVPEAEKIIKTYFQEDEFTIKYLFFNSQQADKPA